MKTGKTESEIALTEEEFQSIWFEGMWYTVSLPRNNAIIELYDRLFKKKTCKDCKAAETAKDRMKGLRDAAESKYIKS